jgi:O-methyltransferase
MATSTDTTTTTPATLEAMYLDLLKRCLTRSSFGPHYHKYDFPAGTMRHALFEPVRRGLASRNLEIVRNHTADPSVRLEGRDWPADAETMIGMKRLDNVQACVTDAVRNGVPGDLIETGVWRGGAVILMRAVLKALGDTRRVVWAADSFQGLPRPDAERYPADAADRHWSFAPLAVSVDEVKRNFERYGLLDDQVRFLVGWFKDTLPTAPIEKLAVARLDGDMYESTMDALEALYPKLSVGGYLIVDDYGWVPGCKQAVDDYRGRHDIGDALRTIDWSGVFWQRSR